MITEAIIEVLLALLSSVSGVSSSIIELFYTKKTILVREKKQREILSDKVEKLTQSLHESSLLMAEIETEFTKQKELADKWNDEAKISKIVVSMNQDEIDAVTKVFGNQLEKENKRTGQKSWWWSLFFCLFGIAGGYIAGKYLPQ